MQHSFGSLRKTPNAKPIQFDQLPLAELHVHVEGGAVSNKVLLKCATRNNMRVPDDLFNEDGTLNYKKGDFVDFLSVYDKASKFVCTPQDVTDITFDYLERCAKQGAIYVELSFSPEHLQQTNEQYEDIQNKHNQTQSRNEAPMPTLTPTKPASVSYEDFVKAIAAGIDKAEKKYNINARILMVLLRHIPLPDCEKTLDKILGYRHPYVVGIQMAGDEINYPSKSFANLFQKAKTAGLKCSSHTGEFSGPAEIDDAIKELNLDRIAHGVHAIEDETLIEKIKASNIGLEVCPTSNVHLGVYSDLKNHPLGEFVKRGVQCSINTDDPAFFGSDIREEYKKVQTQWGYADAQMLAFTRNAVNMSFAEPTLKTKLLCQLALYEAVKTLEAKLNPFQNTDLYRILKTYTEDPSDFWANQLCTDYREAATEITSLTDNEINDFEKAHREFQAALQGYSLEDAVPNQPGTRREQNLSRSKIVY